MSSASPVRTPLTLTEVASSTAPELPMEAIEPVISQEYQRHFYDSQGVLSASNGASTSSITIPALRSVIVPADATVYTYIDEDGNKRIADTLTRTGVGLWRYQARIGVIASYNGESITTPYSSSTGALDIGAEIRYVLATLPTAQTLTLGELQTYFFANRFIL